MDKFMTKYLLNLAGEYRVCAELLRRQMLSSVTLGNLKGADIHIVTENRKVIVVEVKTTERKRFVTGFFQKYKTKTTLHPDFWVLCRLNSSGDEFYVLSHTELARIQAKRNGLDTKFNWDVAHGKWAKGVDNVTVADVEKYLNAWAKIEKKAGLPQN